MSIRTRLVLTFLVIGSLGFYLLTRWLVNDLRPRYLETLEESMVDTATVLSCMVAPTSAGDGPTLAPLRLAMDEATRRRISARIYDITKTRVNVRVYVTDTRGVVLFDSDGGRDEGKDYSKWNDVCRTLRGAYGARTTLVVPGDQRTAILHVASPILSDGKLVGVLTVCKPADSLTLFLEAARMNTIFGGALAAVAVILLGMVLTVWITRPIRHLTDYANAIRDGHRMPLPALGRSEIGTLGASFETMREALEGRQYVENYIQTLTHEMKSPLSTISGASELLAEDMPADQRARFLANIRRETARIQDLVDRLLLLASLENRRELHDIETLDLSGLVHDVADSLQPLAEQRAVRILINGAAPPAVRGERFLLRHALVNLLQNALDFSPPDSVVEIEIGVDGAHARVTVVDHGPGIPDYALPKVFDRFYSLARPESGKKSSGLGLTFVREVATLHQGSVTIENRVAPDHGVRAILRLPAVS